MKLSTINQPFGDLPVATQLALQAWPLRLQLKSSDGKWSIVWPTVWYDAYTYRVHPEDICSVGLCCEPSVTHGGKCKGCR